MPKTGDGDVDHAERLAASADAERDGWIRTLDDMRSMAAELEDEGWDVIAIGAGDTAPEHPEVGRTDRFGLVHVIPDDKADAFVEAFERGTFPNYRVFRNETNGRAFIVTRLLDPDTEQAILLAGTFELRNATSLVKTAMDEGEMYTHVQTIDKTVLGAFRHDDYESFFPNPERYDSYVRESSAHESGG